MISTDPKILKRSAALLRNGCANYDTAADYLDAAATEITGLKAQLTAALAERDSWLAAHDAIYSECKGLKAENANLRAAVRGRTMYHSDEAVMQELGEVRAERDEAWGAWQQGAEAMREAAKFKIHNLDTIQRHTVMDVLRTLPVPERKEG
jgi:hypothetical protein